MPDSKTDMERWSGDYHSREWEERSAHASRFIPAGSRVVDLGCGAMTLATMLPPACSYQGVDVVARNSSTIVCDFNQGQFPAGLQADIFTALGLLEYLHDVPAFFNRLAGYGKPAVISYCAAEISPDMDRPSKGWVNSFTLEELVAIAARSGFRAQRIERIDKVQVLIRFESAPVPVLPRPMTVRVLSYACANNFGDRLGIHLLPSILPANAIVEQLCYRDLAAPADNCDLFILNIGNSLHSQLMTRELMQHMGSARHSIGIFGTQYRHNLRPQALSPVLDNLDYWYARSFEDIMLYGKGRNNVRHLGDWLIALMPITRWSRDETLTVGPEICYEEPLDRAIEEIQKYRRVHSPRMHPLLAALCSAEAVSYTEQREDGTKRVAGKFRSLFLDIFGATMPENALFPVDRRAVAEYKWKVEQNIRSLRHDVAKLNMA